MCRLNVAFELLRKLLTNEIKVRSRKFLIQSRSFAELLEETLRKFQNRAIETAQVVEELIRLAKEIQEAGRAMLGKKIILVGIGIACPCVAVISKKSFVFCSSKRHEYLDMSLLPEFSFSSIVSLSVAMRTELCRRVAYGTQ